MAARQLTWFAAREKHSDMRCDIEVGMANQLAATATPSRMLCDARIISIFRRAAEIRAQVIARGPRSGRN
jgi:(2S)-methylsuccinyl-CoA dehydrogenase